MYVLVFLSQFQKKLWLKKNNKWQQKESQKSYIYIYNVSNFLIINNFSKISFPRFCFFSKLLVLGEFEHGIIERFYVVQNIFRMCFVFLNVLHMFFECYCNIVIKRWTTSQAANFKYWIKVLVYDKRFFTKNAR